MEQFDYRFLDNSIPPSPIISIQISPPDWRHSVSTEIMTLDALLDTGADFTLIPLEIVSILQLEVIEFGVPIDGLGGGTAYGYGCYANFQIGQKPLKAIRVYGCQRDLIGNMAIIGRNLLNQCCIEFDGIHQRITFRLIQD